MKVIGNIALFAESSRAHRTWRVIDEHWHWIALTAMSLTILRWFVPEIQHATIAYNDGVFHSAIIRGMDQAWEHGGNVLDFWMANVSFGHAFLRSYQFLMHLIIWVVHRLLLPWLSMEQSFALTVTAAAMSLPWAFYKGGRLLGMNRLEAVFTGFFSILVEEAGGYGVSLHNITYSGYGTYGHFFGVVFFVLAVGYVHQVLRTGKHVLAASLMFAATFMSSIICGYFLCFWMLFDFAMAVAMDRRPLKAMLIALAKVGALILLWTGHWLIPMMQDGLLQYRSHYEWAIKWTGHGAQVIVKDLVTGNTLDCGRFPRLTIVAGLGVLVCLGAWIGRRGRAVDQKKLRRYLFVQAILWLLLSFGPATWGDLLTVLPFSSKMHWHRAFCFMEIAIIFCAGMGAGAFWAWLSQECKKPAANVAACVSLAAAIFAPVLNDRETYFADTNVHWLKEAKSSWNDKTTGYQDALAYALSHRDARWHVGYFWDWGNTFLVTHYIPFYALLTQFNIENIDSIHHHQPHTETVAYKMDWRNPAHTELANVRYIGLKPTDVPPPGLTPIFNTKNARFYDNGNKKGYFDVGTEIPGGCADNDSLAAASQTYLRSRLLLSHQYAVIHLGKSCSEVIEKLATAERGSLNYSAPGKILESGKEDAPSSDLHWARVKMDQAGLVVFKMNYHPLWVAKVDGKRVPTEMVVPAFSAVRLEPGEHRIEMWYEPSLFKRALTWLTAVCLLLIPVARSIHKRRKILA